MKFQPGQSGNPAGRPPGVRSAYVLRGERLYFPVNSENEPAAAASVIGASNAAPSAAASGQGEGGGLYFPVNSGASRSKINPG
jgi:Family of unknown function (DUF5681)